MDALTAAIVAYSVLNLASFLIYGVDKRKAIKDEWRVKESTMLLLAAIGPFGAAAGMSLFHHKTHKPLFKLVYVFLAVHVIIIAWLVWQSLI
jgi:uncharacterized membrane protein YsdA (DUF1294 family)